MYTIVYEAVYSAPEFLPPGTPRSPTSPLGPGIPERPRSPSLPGRPLRPRCPVGPICPRMPLGPCHKSTKDKLTTDTLLKSCYFFCVHPHQICIYCETVGLSP